MNKNCILVVGDKFSAFTAEKPVMTISQLRGLLALNGIVTMKHEHLVLVPGQGLSEEDMAAVLAAAPTDGSYDLSLWQARRPRADAALSHKKNKRNTLISAPRRLDDTTYELDLLVDEECEVMSDHQTGQHLQGMLLIEAARQAFLAVSEAFFLPQDGTRYYFIFDSLSVAYKRFVFPVDARLIYHVREREGTAGKQRFAVEVVIEQCGQEVATVSGAFTTVKDARVTRMENGLAAEVVASHLAGVATAASTHATAAA